MKEVENKMIFENLVERFLEGVAIECVVYRYVLATIVNPEVHDTWVVLCLTHGIGDVAATLGVLNPERADALVGIRQCQTARLWMRET